MPLKEYSESVSGENPKQSKKNKQQNHSHLISMLWTSRWISNEPGDIMWEM